MKDYKELEVWKRGILLVLEIYETAKAFPKDEIYALTDQIKRAAVSIPSNIAEGASRNTKKEFIQFLYIALIPFTFLNRLPTNVFFNLIRRVNHEVFKNCMFRIGLQFCIFDFC